MINSVNTFNSAKIVASKLGMRVTDATNQQQVLAFFDAVKSELLSMKTKHNQLIDILQQHIKVLEAQIANGITVNDTGVVSLGLASATTSGALSAADWGTFNGKQDHSNELDGIAGLSDAPGLMKKTGDGTYEIDGSVYLTSDYISDSAYGVGWDNDTTHAASKNAIYDQLVTMGATASDDSIVYAIALG